jgi:hypothetical protein
MVVRTYDEQPCQKVTDVSHFFFGKLELHRLPALPTTPRRLGDVAFHKAVQRDDFDFLELSAETSAISPNR